MYTYTCTQLKNTIAVLAPRLSYRLGTSTGSFSTDAKGFCCSLVQSTKTSQYAFHETMSTTVTNWDVDRMQIICKQIHEMLVDMSLDTANYVKPESISGAFDARLVNQEETVRVKWSWMVRTGKLQTPAGTTMANPNITVMIMLDDHQAEASGHQLREESSPAGFALSARPKPEQRAPDQEAQLPTRVPPNDEYASAMIEIPTRIRVSGYSGTCDAVPSFADMGSRPFTKCHCYWYKPGGHCADWVKNGWICPGLAKHSREGGQCYCPYNPFPFKYEHCRQAWEDRGWKCPWTPGNPIPRQTTNYVMNIELPYYRDTCFYPNCGSWDVFWSTRSPSLRCPGTALYGKCNKCGRTQGR